MHPEQNTNVAEFRRIDPHLTASERPGLLKSQPWQRSLNNRALPCLQIRRIEVGLTVRKIASRGQLHKLPGKELFPAEEVGTLDEIRRMQKHVLCPLVPEEAGAQHQPLEGLGKKEQQVLVAAKCKDRLDLGSKSRTVGDDQNRVCSSVANCPKDVSLPLF